MDNLLFYLHLMRHALIVGPLMAGVCALLSVFIVLRRMAMISEAIAHAGLGGLSLSLLLGYWWSFPNTYWGQELITGAFCIATALLIGLFSRGKEVSEDSSIGIFLVASVSVGIVMLFIRRSMPGVNPMPLDPEAVLFGSINSVGAVDAWTMGVVTAGVFAIVLLALPSFIYTTMDEEMARVSGVKTWLVNLLLLVMVSIVITVAARMVGTLMINALMILPGATARLLSRRFNRVLAWSMVIGVCGVTASLLGTIGMAMVAQDVPWLSHVPTGPVLVLALFAIFLVTWGVSRALRRERKRRSGKSQPKRKSDRQALAGAVSETIA